MNKAIRIGTRDSQLAVWQATQVRQLLNQNGYPADIVKIKSEGDLDLETPLYEMGVQGVFTRSLDAALLQNKIDVAVHSMKDVPTVPARGIVQAAVLKRGAVQDLLVYKHDTAFLREKNSVATIATGSVRRRAQWLHRYPAHRVVDLRGNVNTRLRKLSESDWQGAVFAAAGLERIHLRPEQSIALDWMLPAPAQGAIMVVCRQNDTTVLDACLPLNDTETALCTRTERDFLRALMGGCATPISAYAYIENGQLFFEGNILSADGKKKLEIKRALPVSQATVLGKKAGEALWQAGGEEIVKTFKA